MPPGRSANLAERDDARRGAPRGRRPPGNAVTRTARAGRVPPVKEIAARQWRNRMHSSHQAAWSGSGVHVSWVGYRLDIHETSTADKRCSAHEESDPPQSAPSRIASHSEETELIRDAEPGLSVLTGRWTVSLPCGMGRGHRHRPPGDGAAARWAAADGPRFGTKRDRCRPPGEAPPTSSSATVA